MDSKRCMKCGALKPLSEFHKLKRSWDGFNYWCKACKNDYLRDYRNHTGGYRPLGTNPDCPLFLGVYVAERVLAHVFKNVSRMPKNNPGFDFICGGGYKIDVKSATRGKNHPNMWVFGINKNTMADYFLLIAFDNRSDLNPEHIWLVPGNKINNRRTTSISESTLAKWEDYRPLDKLDEVIHCCDILKGAM